MSNHFADRLTEAIRTKGNSLCVGIDPRWSFLPSEIRNRYSTESLEEIASALEEFAFGVLEMVAPLVAIVKPQSAFFEACGPAGMKALQSVLKRAGEQGLLTILDNKRNDIAGTAQAYADAAFAGVPFDGKVHPIWNADAVTINPYLGRDAVEPFLQSARQDGRGVFVLVRTSNAGAGQFQDLVSGGKPLFHHVAQAVAAWGDENLGEGGYADVGAVVGATHPEEMRLIRDILPHAYFLIPGFGAQGGSAEDTSAGFRSDGLGAVVNSSRGIIACFDPADADWQFQIRQGTMQTVKQLKLATPMGKLSS